MAQKLYSLAGFTRFKFDANGDCYNAISGEKRKREKWSSGREFVRLLNDSGKREVVYSADIAEKVKAIVDAETENKETVNKLEKAGFNKPVVSTHTKVVPGYKDTGIPATANLIDKKKLSDEDVLEMHRKKAAGISVKDIASEYGRQPGATRNILLGIRYPELYQQFLAEQKQA